MRLRKLISFISISAMFVASNTSIVLASTEDISIVVNGSNVEFDTKPFVNESGRTMVPVSSIAKMLDAEVKWDGQKQQVTITKGETKLVLTIGSDIIEINGEMVQMDTEASMVGGRTMVPLSIIAKSFNADIVWDGKTKTVSIKTEDSGSNNLNNTNNSNNTVSNDVTTLNSKEIKVTNITSNSIDIEYSYGNKTKVYLAIANDEYASIIDELSQEEFANFVLTSEIKPQELVVMTFRIDSMGDFFAPDTNYTIYIMEDEGNGNYTTISSEKFTTAKESANSESFNLEYNFVELNDGYAYIEVSDKNNNKGFEVYSYSQEKDMTLDTYIEPSDITIDFLTTNGYPLSSNGTNYLYFGFEATPGKTYELYFVVMKDDLVSDINYLEVKTL